MITQPTPIQPGAAAAPDTAVTRPLYQDPTAAIPDRVADLLGRMTLAEKIGQMTLVEKNSIAPDEVTRHAIGALLSGGGGFPGERGEDGLRARQGEGGGPSLPEPGRPGRGLRRLRARLRLVERHDDRAADAVARHQAR